MSNRRSVKVKKDQYPLATVTGRVIVGSMQIVSMLAKKVGEDLLALMSVSEISEDKIYSYEVRREIHELVFNRFGDAGLMNCGFMTVVVNLKSDVNNFTKKSRNWSRRYKERNKNDSASDYLDAAVLYFFNQYNDWIKRDNQTNTEHEFGASIKKNAKNQYVVWVDTTIPLRHSSFLQGIILGFLSHFLIDNWMCDFKLQKQHCEEGEFWGKTVWRLSFKKRKKTISSTEALAIVNQGISDNFLEAVLEDAYLQKKKVEDLSQQLGKYLPPHLHRALSRGKHNYGITTRRKKLTIFFSDIKNFTATSENLQPEDLTKFLNNYFSEMTAIALEYGATIDKYIGDAMMLFFGDPESKGDREDARACVKMALRMQHRMGELQERWRNEGFSDPFQIRMGINTGYCNVGNFGSEQRLTYTIIGGEVNVAQRLEANSDANGILMSYETYAYSQDLVEVEKRESIKMKGVSRNIETFAVLTREKNNPYMPVDSSVVSLKKTKQETSDTILK